MLRFHCELGGNLNSDHATNTSHLTAAVSLHSYSCNAPETFPVFNLALHGFACGSTPIWPFVSPPRHELRCRIRSERASKEIT